MATTKVLLQSGGYQLLLQSFSEWLTLLNYSEWSIPGLSSAVRDFLYYQEAMGKLSVEQLVASDANDFINYLRTKGSVITGEPYSSKSINKYIQALKLVSRYLRETKRSDVSFSLQRLVEKSNKPAWLTEGEIKQLYEAIKDNVLGMRDKAMLAVFYGCGLRLQEGASLELKDVNIMGKVLHVRKGKCYKERFVPIAEKNVEALKAYIAYGRPQLLKEDESRAFFIGANKGVQLNKQTLYIRIKALVKQSRINKKVGMHSLRHSIATHLLQSGMKLEWIQRFLGHSHLDSTQIYTHLTNELP